MNDKENLLNVYGAGERQFMEATLYPDFSLARVTSQYKNIYKIITDEGERLGELSGRFLHQAKVPADFPAVGDFVMIDKGDGTEGNAVIHHLLTRKSLFRRVSVGNEHQAQLIAANVDLVFVCMSLNNNYNKNRMERYLSAAWDSGAVPVAVLTKSDLCENLAAVTAEIMAIAPGTDIITTSGFDRESCEKLLEYLKPGVTASFIGSSGVGKSTLINCLAGKEIMETSEIRQDDDKGRHTTTRREMFVLPQGGIVIDTPGMRELGVESVDLSKSFADIDELAAECRFGDCTHTSEPGCAVRAALEDGSLDQRRLDSYLKLKKEAKYEGLSAKQIETEKLNSMFEEVGGMKNIRKFNRQNDKRKR